MHLQTTVMVYHMAFYLQIDARVKFDVEPIKKETPSQVPVCSPGVLS